MRKDSWGGCRVVKTVEKSESAEGCGRWQVSLADAPWSQATYQDGLRPRRAHKSMGEGMPVVDEGLRPVRDLGQLVLECGALHRRHAVQLAAGDALVAEIPLPPGRECGDVRVRDCLDDALNESLDLVQLGGSWPHVGWLGRLRQRELAQ